MTSGSGHLRLQFEQHWTIEVPWVCFNIILEASKTRKEIANNIVLSLV